MKAQLHEQFLMPHNEFPFLFVEGENQMYQQLLGRNPVRGCREAIEQDALMGSMLIDDIKLLLILGNYISKRHLAYG